MDWNQVAMIASVLGIEEPSLINSRGLVYPTKRLNVDDIRNHEQRLSDANEKRHLRALKKMGMKP